MKNKGFVLMETIVVIVIISVTLLTIFSSYNKILSKVKTENKYDTSEYIYMTYHIKKYLSNKELGAENIDTEDKITNHAIDYDLPNSIFNVKKIYIVTNLNELENNKEKFDAYMIDYIRKLDVEDNDKLIIVEYTRPAKVEGTNDTLKEYGTTNVLSETYIASLEW